MNDDRTTGTDYNPVELYWRDIKDSQPLSREEEAELFRRVRAGDEGARQRVIEANLRFVVSIAREYKEYSMSLIELISEGNMGLLEAVGRFDETRGFKFITYAVWWIRQAILKALAERGRIARPPMSQINDLQKIEREASHLAQELGRDPSFEEIAARVDISAERTHNALEVSQADLSFDAPAYADEESPLLSVFAAEEEAGDERIAAKEMKESVARCLDALDERECRIVYAYFGLKDAEPMTLEEIGAAMGITRERVRQLRNRALAKMRAHCREHLLEFSSLAA